MATGIPPLALSKLTKQYAGMPALALDNVSLTVNAGEVYGFLGANGAGKSTTIRTLLNFIQPTSGSATIVGHDIVTENVAAKRFVGYLAGEVALYGKATGKQMLAYLGTLQPPKHKAYVKQLVTRFDVTLNQRIDTLSKGNRQKLGIVQAFMHEPEVLILDEPTSGLDPLMQEEFFKLIRESKDRGAAIFLSSHNLSETQRICDRVGIIKHGRLIREQSISELTDMSTPVFKVRLAHLTAADRVKREPHLKFISQLDGVTLLVQPRDSISAALSALSRYDIKSMTTEHIDLEGEFMKFYEEN